MAFFSVLSAVASGGADLDLDADSFAAKKHLIGRDVGILGQPRGGDGHAPNTFIPLQVVLCATGTFLSQRAALSRRFEQSEVAFLVNVGPADDLKWATRF